MIQTAWYHCIRAPSVPTESCTAERESATPADGGILRLPDPVPVVFVEAVRSAQRAAEEAGTAQALPCSRSSAVIALFFSPKM